MARDWAGEARAHDERAGDGSSAPNFRLHQRTIPTINLLSSNPTMAPSRALLRRIASVQPHTRSIPPLHLRCLSTSSRIRAQPSLLDCARPTPVSTLHRDPTRCTPVCIRSYSQATSDAPEAPEYLSEGELHVFNKIKAELEPVKLEVQDISGGCGSMYALVIESPKFKGLSVIKQHKLVNQVLKEEISSWHGVQLRTRAP